MNIKSAPRLGRIAHGTIGLVRARARASVFILWQRSGCIIPHLCHSLLRVYVSLDAGSHAGSDAVWVTILITVMMLSMTYVLFSNSFFYALNVLVVPPLIFVHMSYMLARGEWSGRMSGFLEMRLTTDSAELSSFSHHPEGYPVLCLP